MTPSSGPDARIDAYLLRRGVASHLVGIGLDGLIARWGAVVDEVSTGYAGDLDEYLNDLDLRQILDDAVAAVVETRGPLLDRLRDADARFVAHTRAVATHLWGTAGRGDVRRNWWYFRVPLRMPEELAEDLTARSD